MYIVTNTLTVKADYVERIVKRFKAPNVDELMAEVSGFRGLELWTQQLEDETLAELVILSRWDSKAEQEAWVQSDSFKRLHGRKKDGTPAERSSDSPILGNKLGRYYTIED